MFLDKKPYTFDSVARMAIIVGLLCGLIWALGYLSDVLIPFTVALLLAYLINPLVIFVQKKIPNRSAAVCISLLAVSGLVIALAWFIIPKIINEITQMGRTLSELVNNSKLAEQSAKRLPPDLWQALKDYAAKKEVQNFFKADNFRKMVESLLQKILPGVWGLITGTASFLMGLIGLAVIGLYLVFLLLDYQRIVIWKDLLLPTHREKIISFVSEFDTAMSRYFRGQAVIASIVGVLFAIGFWLINLPMGIILGLFIGILNMVPYLQIIGLIPAFLLALVHALVTGTSFWTALGLTGLVFVVVQITQDAILVPKIMGRITGLSPVIILLSLSIWGKLLGIFGLLIALPMTSLLLAYYRGFLTTAKAGASSSGGSLTDK